MNEYPLALLDVMDQVLVDEDRARRRAEARARARRR